MLSSSSPSFSLLRRLSAGHISFKKNSIIFKFIPGQRTTERRQMCYELAQGCWCDNHDEYECVAGWSICEALWHNTIGMRFFHILLVIVIVSVRSRL